MNLPGHVLLSQLDIFLHWKRVNLYPTNSDSPERTSSITSAKLSVLHVALWFLYLFLQAVSMLFKVIVFYLSCEEQRLAHLHRMLHQKQQETSPYYYYHLMKVECLTGVYRDRHPLPPFVMSRCLMMLLHQFLYLGLWFLVHFAETEQACLLPHDLPYK